MYLLEQCRGVISDGIDFENHDPSNVGMRFEIFLPSPDTHCFQSVVGVRWQQPLSVGDTIGSTRITGTEIFFNFFNIYIYNIYNIYMSTSDRCDSIHCYYK